jgi:predicted TIM-barrel fold metal-dependent hydrolase
MRCGKGCLGPSTRRYKSFENCSTPVSLWASAKVYPGTGIRSGSESPGTNGLQICKVMDLGREYKVPVQYHTGFPSGYAGAIDLAREQGHYSESEWANPLLCHEVAALYPDVNIILAHAGIEGSGYYTEYYEKCLNVAAAHNNVYLETGMWWAELYAKPLKDPSIGAEKLIWGTDMGASSTPQVWMPGETPETYCSQDVKEGPPSYQINVFAWSLRELGRLNIPQDDLDLILGGNAVRVFGLKTPFTRLFREPRNKNLFWKGKGEKSEEKKG